MSRDTAAARAQRSDPAPPPHRPPTTEAPVAAAPEPDGHGTRVERRAEERGGLQLRTLLIAALASGTAAVLTSYFWRRGTAISAALTPVLVALISEALHKPAERISQITTVKPQLPAIASARRSEQEAAARVPDVAPALRDAGRTVPPPGTAGEAARARPAVAAPATGDAPQKVRVYRRRRFHLGLALGTGLLAFLIAAVALTVPELVGGKAIGGGGSTTLFSTKEKDGGDRDGSGSGERSNDRDAAGGGGGDGSGGGGSDEPQQQEPSGEQPGGEEPQSPVPEAPSAPQP